MTRRVAVSVEVPGLRIEYEGAQDLYEAVLREVVSPIARGAWRTSGAPLRTDSAAFLAEAAPASVLPSVPAAAVLAPAAPTSFPVREPAPRPEAAFDPAPLFARLAAEKGRRAEKDAVLLALVSLGNRGRRDATPAEIVAHLEAHGYATRDLKPRPILAKLSHRKGLAAPGVLPNTFRATPTGAAYIWKRAAGV